MTLSRRELRQRANEEAARLAAEASGASAADAAPPDESVPVAQPLPAQPTRRELRQMRILQETGEIPVVRDEVPPRAPDLNAEVHVGEDLEQSPPLAASPEPKIARPVRRRRPVLPPQESGSSPVIDPATGAIAAITISIPAEPEPGPGPGSDSEGAGAREEAASPLLSAPGTTPQPSEATAGSPERAHQLPAEPLLPPPPPVSRHEIDFDSIVSGVDSTPVHAAQESLDETSTPRRASLFDKLNDETDAELNRAVEPAEPDDEPEQLLTVEQAAVQSHASPAVTFLRYLVLVIAMFVIGGLLWLIADRAVATELSMAILKTISQGGVGT